MKELESNKNDEEKIRGFESQMKPLNYKNERLNQENIGKEYLWKHSLIKHTCS